MPVIVSKIHPGSQHAHFCDSTYRVWVTTMKLMSLPFMVRFIAEHSEATNLDDGSPILS